MTSQATEVSSIRPLSNVNDLICENCDDEVYNCGNVDGDIPSTLRKLKIKNDRFIIGHLNINSLPNKF